MSDRHEMPDDPTRNPEQALDALEQRVLGETANQERDDQDDPGPEDTGDDGAASTPVADEPPA